MRHDSRIAAVLVIASACNAASAQKPSIYDAKADAREAVAKAALKAKSDNSRVLVMFGGDWCGWCHKLHALFRSNPEIRKTLSDEYVLVMVDTKAPNAEALLDECKGDLKSVGYPFLAVLDGDAKVVTRQQTDPLEEGDHHDPAKVKSFLDQWSAPKQNAESVLSAALARAKGEDKRVFLHFGAPWCGWCHKLDDFLAMKDVAEVIGTDFVEVKIDTDRMTGGKEALARFRPGLLGGIPWFAVLDAEGKPLVTSDGPNGNIGYPAAPGEIDHFITMLTKTARKIDAPQIEALKAKLKDEAKKIEEASKARSAAKSE